MVGWSGGASGALHLPMQRCGCADQVVRSGLPGCHARRSQASGAGAGGGGGGAVTGGRVASCAALAASRLALAAMLALRAIALRSSGSRRLIASAPPLADPSFVHVMARVLARLGRLAQERDASEPFSFLSPSSAGSVDLDSVTAPLARGGSLVALWDGVLLCLCLSDVVLLRRAPEAGIANCIDRARMRVQRGCS